MTVVLGIKLESGFVIFYFCNDIFVVVRDVFSVVTG